MQVVKTTVMVFRNWEEGNWGKSGNMEKVKSEVKSRRLKATSIWDLRLHYKKLLHETS